ncbi:hypothetical protein [Arthrobacter sp. JUb115]|uniref:hypothetical protein n=1 Tax=Micrococcaceae TaxID=1268 RepID=UPI001061E7BA|nr:hypothetical protein [Arthrobacter sp. JUb115]TDU25984.1 hypothetical protein EDF61_10546 [Arthrobacter sp. JUb115]
MGPSTGASGNGNGKLTSKLIPITSANTTVLPVGVQFIEPTIRTGGLGTVLLDEAVGESWWTLHPAVPGNDPAEILPARTLANYEELGAPGRRCSRNPLRMARKPLMLSWQQ